MVARRRQEPFEGHAIEHVLARVQFESGVAARLVVSLGDRHPASRQFGERRFDKAGQALRPGVNEGPSGRL